LQHSSMAAMSMSSGMPDGASVAMAACMGQGGDGAKLAATPWKGSHRHIAMSHIRRMAHSRQRWTQLARYRV
jgi:hypothetical protein